MARTKFQLKATVFFIFLCTIAARISLAQPPTPPFNRGLNLTNWFQANSAREINFRRYSKKDFENIKSLGCDVMRLPINLKGMTNGSPNYILDPLFFTFLDSAVVWAENLEMHLILDNHSFSVTENTVQGDIDYLLKVWSQMADHYKNSSELIYYEVLNEPHGIADATWNTMQQQVINAIRKIDEKHTIVVGPAGWNSYNNLAAMPNYEDENLLYTFHFYDPFLFTHQGASWVDPSMVPLKDVPFPYNREEMPALDPSFNGTWIQSAYNNYHNEGTVAHVKSLLDIAISFRDERNVPIFCGEFGVYQPNSDEEDRVYWYGVVREYLEENGIAWTMWDYHHGYGMYNEGSSGYFEHDLNVPLLEALDLNVPEQTPYEKQPESTGFMLYDDFLGKDIQNSSYTQGQLTYFAGDRPNNGTYAIKWANASQYNSIGFDFQPEKDLSALAEGGYSLDMFIRGLDVSQSFNFDIRFIDTKTDESDRPWRNRYTITRDDVSFDGMWHHVHIPLQEFTEHGAWDGAWFNPQGDFDWSAIDRMEITSESAAFEGALWFDNIMITNKDTSRVWEDSHVSDPVTGILPESSGAFLVYPNPTRENVYVRLESPFLLDDKLLVYDSKGRIVDTVVLSGKNEFMINSSELVRGMYILKMKEGKLNARFFKL